MPESYVIRKDEQDLISFNREELKIVRDLINEVILEGSVSSEVYLPDGTFIEIELEDFVDESEE